MNLVHNQGLAMAQLYSYAKIINVVRRTLITKQFCGPDLKKRRVSFTHELCRISELFMIKEDGKTQPPMGFELWTLAPTSGSTLYHNIEH